MTLSLYPSFTLNLEQQLHQSQVVVGKFDGKKPSLACVVPGGKILLHSPHDDASDDSQNHIRYLNFNRKVTALQSGTLSGHDNDILFMGTESNLSAYDIGRNADIFFKEVSEGVNTILIGTSNTTSDSVTYIGGNCSILGYDSNGNEIYWTVTGDNVSAMIVLDIDQDSNMELVIGSDDCAIRIYKSIEMFYEIIEADKITHLTFIQNNLFAYGLSNGTVGVYNGYKSRLWRVKTKTIPTSLLACDIGNDGIMKIVSGWLNGTFNIRHYENGELLYRGNVDSSIVSILYYDYKLDGRSQLLVCSQSGQIIGYQYNDTETMVASMNIQGGTKDTHILPLGYKGNQYKEEQKQLLELQHMKQDLIMQLKQIEKSMIQMKTGEIVPGGLPPNTSIKFELLPDLTNGCLNLYGNATTDVLIVSLIVIDLEGALLDGCETVAVTPAIPSKKATISLRPVKFQSCSLRVQAHVATRGTLETLHVLEYKVTVPKFACFQNVTDEEANDIITTVTEARTRGQVVLLVNETINRITEWISDSFLISSAIQFNIDKMKLCFLSTCGPISHLSSNTTLHHDSTTDPTMTTSSTTTTITTTITTMDIPDKQVKGQYRPLQLLASQDTRTGYLKIKIRTDTMELAADVLQNLIKYFKIEECETEIDFPEEIEEFEEIAHRVEELQEMRMKLMADMLDNTHSIKAQVVRAEDHRILNNMDAMRRAYTSLNTLNVQLLQQYNTRNTTQQQLLEGLKSINLMIQRAANLRVGKTKASIISDCRQAVKSGNMTALQRIIRYGSEKNANTLSHLS